MIWPQHEPVLVLTALAAALVIDWLFGEPDILYRHVPHPAVLMGRAVGWLDRTFNRHRNGRGTGALVLAVFLTGAIFLGWVLDGLFLLLPVPLDVLMHAAAISVLLAQRSLYDHVKAVAEGLDTGGLAAGREAVAHIVGRDPQSLDEAGVCRAAIESCAENFADGVVAPVFWYLLFGLPGILAYKALNTADSMIGHKTPRHLHFGWAAARLDDAANYLPARLSGLLIAFASTLLSETSSHGAFRAMFHDAGKHTSPNAGWPEAAMAGALRLRLAGPRHYGDLTVDGAWMGGGRADQDADDIRRALGLYRAATMIPLVAVIFLAFVV